MHYLLPTYYEPTFFIPLPPRANLTWTAILELCLFCASEHPPISNPCIPSPASFLRQWIQCTAMDIEDVHLLSERQALFDQCQGPCIPRTVWVTFAETVLNMSTEQGHFYFDHFQLFQLHQQRLFPSQKTRENPSSREGVLYPSEVPTVHALSFVLYLVHQLCISEVLSKCPLFGEEEPSWTCSNYGKEQSQLQSLVFAFYRKEMLKILVVLSALQRGTLPHYKSRRNKGAGIFHDDDFNTFITQLQKGSFSISFRENELEVFDFLFFSVFKRGAPATIPANPNVQIPGNGAIPNIATTTVIDNVIEVPTNPALQPGGGAPSGELHHRLSCTGNNLSFPKDAVYKMLAKSRSRSLIEDPSEFAFGLTDIGYVRVNGIRRLLHSAFHGTHGASSPSSTEPPLGMLDINVVLRLLLHHLRPYSPMYHHVTLLSNNMKQGEEQQQLGIKIYGTTCLFKGLLPPGFDDAKQFRKAFPFKILIANEMNQKISYQQEQNATQGQELVVMNCNRCTFNLNAPLTSITLIQCHRCTFHWEKSVPIVAVAKLWECQLEGVCTRLLIRQSATSHFQIFSSTPPIVMTSCSKAQETPSTLAYSIPESNGSLNPAISFWLDPRRNKVLNPMSLWPKCPHNKEAPQHLDVPLIAEYNPGAIQNDPSLEKWLLQLEEDHKSVYNNYLEIDGAENDIQ